jgi:predicted nucleotidyltransferase
MLNINSISKIVNKHPSMIKGCYIFGSRVYKTNNEDSDWDIILVVNNSVPEVEYKDELYNIHLITPDLFEKQIRDNHIRAIECIFAPNWAIIKPYEYNFIFKGNSFRHNISHTVSNSWVKCKKKLEQGDYYIGIKSLFHSLRIGMFANQFAKNNEIDFTQANYIWKELTSKNWTWKELDEKYKPLRNQILSDFRLTCSKI